MHRISTFVEQEDALLGVLTVRESISYALRLQYVVIPIEVYFTKLGYIIYQPSPTSKEPSSRPSRKGNPIFGSSVLCRADNRYCDIKRYFWWPETSRYCSLRNGDIPVSKLSSCKTSLA